MFTLDPAQFRDTAPLEWAVPQFAVDLPEAAGEKDPWAL
jgi:hypothetical protein